MSSEDPYQPPVQTSAPVTRPGSNNTHPCDACGSRNTTAGDLLGSKPGILSFILFGWLGLLARKAFVKSVVTCQDCGAITRFRSPGSVVAALVLLLLLFLIGFAAYSD